MAWCTFRPSEPHSSSNKRQNRRTEEANNISSNLNNLFKTHNNAGSRSSQLDWPVSSSHPSTIVKNKNSAKSFQKSTTRLPNKTQQRNETESRQVDFNTHDSSISRQPSNNNYDTDRCIIKRLGFSDKRKVIPRNIRQNSKLLNQHTGVIDNLVCSFNGEREKCSYSDSMRQLHSCSSCQTLYVHNIPHSNDIGAHLEESNCSKMDTVDLSHSREVQRSSRSIVKKRYPVNRMVSVQKRLPQLNPQGTPKNRSGSVRDKPKSPIENICITMPRQEGNSSGCNDSQLGQVETLVSVSTIEYDFEGFSEIIRDPLQKCDSDNTGDTNQTMVHGITTEEFTIENYECALTTSSGRQTGENIQTYETPRLDLIKTAYGKQYPNCTEAVTLMAAPLRVTSIKDYQHKWKTFMTFILKNNISFDTVTIGNVLQFLTSLFYEKHLKPGTIAHYRTALTVPLKTYFNIDLKVPAVADLLRAMWLQRPNKPVSAPAWSLNKVLEFLDNLPTQIDETTLFRKTAFLLLLATGWRVSELHACVRDEEFCRITENSTLHIRPHPSFLAKNENSQKRWIHKEIRELQLQDGSISNICPVTNLKKYLQCSSDSHLGDIFINPYDHQKKLTIHQLSTHICSLILQADPTTKARVHDVRKYAASCALAETMLVGDLVSAINWSSPATFYKFYLTQTKPLTRQVSLPVQRN